VRRWQLRATTAIGFTKGGMVMLVDHGAVSTRIAYIGRLGGTSELVRTHL